VHEEIEAPFPEPESRPLIHGDPKTLVPTVRKVWQWSSLLSWILSGVVLGVIEFFLMRSILERPWIPVVSPALCLIFAGIAWWMADRQYQAWSYQLREHDLVIAHGVFWKSRRSVARGRVQHIDINSGPLERRWGLVQVSIYVAGALGSVGTIPGLRPEEAESLRAAILEGRHEHA
jgi:uncharacterized protein